MCIGQNLFTNSGMNDQAEIIFIGTIVRFNCVPNSMSVAPLVFNKDNVLSQHSHVLPRG